MTFPRMCTLVAIGLLLVTVASTAEAQQQFALILGDVAPNLGDAASKKPIPLWLFGVIGLGVAAIVWWLMQSDKKRTEQMKAQMAALGGLFRKEATEADQALIANSHLATQGRTRKVFDIAELPTTQRTVLFGFQYWVGIAGQESQTYVLSITRFQSDKLQSLPTFTLKPENIGDKVMTAVGYQDINFPEHPVFSKKYLLRGQDESGIRRLFTADVIAFFEQEPGWIVEVTGDELFAYREDHFPLPEKISDYLQNRRRILDLLTSK